MMKIFLFVVLIFSIVVNMSTANPEADDQLSKAKILPNSPPYPQQHRFVRNVDHEGHDGKTAPKTCCG